MATGAQTSFKFSGRVKELYHSSHPNDEKALLIISIVLLRHHRSWIKLLLAAVLLLLARDIPSATSHVVKPRSRQYWTSLLALNPPNIILGFAHWHDITKLLLGIPSSSQDSPLQRVALGRTITDSNDSTIPRRHYSAAPASKQASKQATDPRTFD